MITFQQIIKLIALQKEVVPAVIDIFDSLPFEKYENDIKGLLQIEEAPAARDKLKEVLRDDPQNMKMLTCMLHALSYTYENYQKIGIDDVIFVSTMKCFTRFLQEHYNGYKEWVFDRDWWTYRQIAMKIFRLGELEYEMKNDGKDNYISLHIPSDAHLAIDKVKTSVTFSEKFFQRYFPDYDKSAYRCRSWLLSPALKSLLPDDSNIIKFQSLFKLTKEDDGGSGYIQWIYKKKYQDYNELPEITTLQKNLKRFLLSGNTLSIGTGILIK